MCFAIMDRNQSSECSVEQNLVVEGIIQNFRFFKCLVFTTLLTSHINHREFKFCYLLFLLVSMDSKNKKIPCFSYSAHFVGNNNIHRYVFDGSIKYRHGQSIQISFFFNSVFQQPPDYTQWINYFGYFGGALTDSLFPRILRACNPKGRYTHVSL